MYKLTDICSANIETKQHKFILHGIGQKYYCTINYYTFYPVISNMLVCNGVDHNY